MRPKIRFEVFKRDGFTCQYCGRKTPDVVLEADHIIPVSEGGTDDIENLVTACFDCNRGKGARLLDDRAPVPDLVEQTEFIREREAQLRQFHAAKAEQTDARDARFSAVWNYWFHIWGQTTLHRWETPWENSLRNYVEKLGVADVKEAMDIARGRFTYISSAAPKYLGGILKRKLIEQEGRATTCSICGEYIELTYEQARLPGPWHHNRCAEKN